MSRSPFDKLRVSGWVTTHFKGDRPVVVILFEKRVTSLPTLSMIKNRFSIVPFALVVVVSWSLLGWLVTGTSPTVPQNRLWFIILLFVSSMSTVSVISYLLTYKIFIYKRYQGDWTRSLLRGGSAALSVSFLAWLQMARGLSLPAFILVCAFLASLELLIWPRRMD